MFAKGSTAIECGGGLKRDGSSARQTSLRPTSRHASRIQDGLLPGNDAGRQLRSLQGAPLRAPRCRTGLEVSAQWTREWRPTRPGRFRDNSPTEPTHMLDEGIHVRALLTGASTAVPKSIGPARPDRRYRSMTTGTRNGRFAVSGGCGHASFHSSRKYPSSRACVCAKSPE